LAVVASLLVCVYILRFTLKFAASNDAPPPPSRAALGPDYRELSAGTTAAGRSRAHDRPAAGYARQMKADTEANQKFEWIDESSGIAQIPVKDAMKIIAEKGLPGSSASATEKKK